MTQIFQLFQLNKIKQTDLCDKVIKEKKKIPSTVEQQSNDSEYNLSVQEDSRSTDNIVNED